MASMDDISEGANDFKRGVLNILLYKDIVYKNKTIQFVLDASTGFLQGSLFIWLAIHDIIPPCDS